MYKDAKALGETVSVSNKMMPDSAPAPSGVPNPGFFMPQSMPNGKSKDRTILSVNYFNVKK